jgi:hypothetical protein
MINNAKFISSKLLINNCAIPSIAIAALQHNARIETIRMRERQKMKFLPVLVLAAVGVSALGNEADKSAPQTPTVATYRAAELEATPGDWAAIDAGVYVDRETRFAFVKTPAGWKFIRQIEAEKMAQVPREFLVPLDRRARTLLALNPKR